MKTLKDIEEEIYRTNIVLSGSLLRKEVKECVKELKKQENLHWEWISRNVGEHPNFELPEGFDCVNNPGLPDGYNEIIKWIKHFFNLEEAE